jgi:autotransporter-associated beta strand protein
MQIFGGTVALASDGAFTPGSFVYLASETVIDSGGRSLNTGGMVSNGGTFALGGGSLTTGGGTINDATTITGGGGFTKTGSDTLEIYAPLNVAGPIRLEDGTTFVNAPDSLPDATAVTVSSPATLHYSSASDTVGSLAGDGTLILEDSTLTIGSANTSTTFSGEISGNGALTKSGPGTLTLSGSNTYTGTTTVSAGTLLVNGSLANSAVTVASGATLGGNGRIGNLTLNVGGTLAPGNSPGTLTAESLDWQGGDLWFELGADNSSSDYLSLTGGLSGSAGSLAFTFLDHGWQIGQTYDLIGFGSTTLAASQFTFTNSGGFDGTFGYNGNSLQFTLTAIPEPSITALIALGLAAIVLRRRLV